MKSLQLFFFLGLCSQKRKKSYWVPSQADKNSSIIINYLYYSEDSRWAKHSANTVKHSYLLLCYVQADLSSTLCVLLAHFYWQEINTLNMEQN